MTLESEEIRVPEGNMSGKTAHEKPIQRRGSSLTRTVAVGAVAAGLVWTLPGVLQAIDRQPSVPEAAVRPTSSGRSDFGNVPLYFEANRGQTDSSVKFLARAKGYNLFLTSDKAVVSLPGDGEDKQGAAVHMSLVGSSSSANITGVSPLPGKVNYLDDADPRMHRTNVPTFSGVSYSNVYPGIDLSFYGNDTNDLEYDFIVAPGADPGVVRLSIEGYESLRLDETGNLVMATVAGEITQHKPVIYQNINGIRQVIEGGFVLDDNKVGFFIGTFDRSKPLVIDPTLAYSSYLDGVVNTQNSLKVDNEGNTYVAGNANAANFPISPGAFRATGNNLGVPSAFVTKFDPSGSGIVYSTYLATLSTGSRAGLALLPDGSVWVTGTNRFLKDVPVTPGAFLTDRLASQGMFLVKLNPAGSAVSYGTYLANSPGVGSLDSAGAIAADPDGDVWIAAAVAGFTTNPGFPTTPGAVKPQCDPDGTVCVSNLLIAKVHPGGNGIADISYATFLGGNRLRAYSLAVGSDGTVHVFGQTPFDIVTTPNALLPTKPGNQDGFLAKFRPAGNGSSDLLYSSFIGGSAPDAGADQGDMALGPDDTVYLTLSTDSFDVAMTPGAFRPFRRDIGDILLQRIDTTQAGLAGLLYSTLVPSDGWDRSSGISVDGRGHAFVTGRGGFNLETRNPLDCCPFDKGPQDNVTFGGDAVVFELNPAGQGDADLIFMSYLGGATGFEFGRDIALAMDTTGRGRVAYVVGTTDSTDFPITPDAYQPLPRPSFLSRIDLSDQILCSQTLTGAVPGPMTVGFGEVVCLNRAAVSKGIVVQPGGELRVQSSFIGGSITATGASAFTLCGTVVNGDVAVTGTSPLFIRSGGQGCVPNTVRGITTLPTTTTPTTPTTTPSSTTTSTVASTTTTLPTTSTTAVSTTTTAPSVTTTLPAATCSSLRAQRVAFNAAIDAAEVGQSPATIAVLEQKRARQNALFDQQLAGCPG